MRRLARALAALSLFALACQDYNFNPVGHCLIQPGTQRVKLADVSTADVLFVVDDSGSMYDEQTNLAGGFSSFITNLKAYNDQRVANALEPIDFHIAITTTANYFIRSVGGTCKAACGGLSNVCCTNLGVPVGSEERACSGPGATCGTGYTCSNTCLHAPGGYVCCNGSGDPERLPVSCTSAQVDAAATCGRIDRRYPGALSTGCTNCCDTWGVGSAYAKWPHGDFVRAPATSNPRVLHFEKGLFDPVNFPGYTGPTIAELTSYFQQNVLVGTCGSGQEQGLDAARYAIEKALAGQQPGVTASEWPHADSKLVVVWVGDEDDCSCAESPIDGVIWADNSSCIGNSRLEDYKAFTGWLSGLGRPIAAAAIVGANPVACQDLVSTATTSACVAGACGNAVAGTRFLDAVGELQGQNAEVVAGSICAPSPNYFGPVLARIADIVKPPAVLTLPTPPAAGQVTMVRILDKNGGTRKTCNGPTTAEPDWWFVPAVNSTTPVAVSQFIFINHATNNCEANPGETYSADYLGRLPESGCAIGGDASDCAAALGGTVADWECIPAAAGDTVGTCVCAG
jgi:hypothetical protein